MSILLVLGLIGVVVSFNQRLLDPLTPLVASEIGVDPTLVVMLSPAFTLPYALGQPFLGPIGDSYGKALVLKVCLIVLTLATVAAAFAPNYETLFVLRVITGLAGGGIIPTSLALIGDRYPIEQRQVAMSRFMVCLVVSQLFSAPVSAGIAQVLNWHYVLVFAACLGIAGLALMVTNIKPRADVERPPLSLSNSLRIYRALLANPRARACYAAVFSEGLLVFGFTPHVALYLKARGLGAVTEAGYALAGFGIGGVVFSIIVSRLVRRFNPYRMMQTGGAMMGGGLILIAIAPHWQAVFGAFSFLGFGFYMLHSGLQAQVTEVMPQARASAVSLHAFFLFLGIASGPVLFEIISRTIGFSPTLMLNGAAMIVASFFAVRMLALTSRA